MRDHYNGIKVGDTVERTGGEWNGCRAGHVAVVTLLENNHIRFGDSTGGHSPQRHKIISPASPIDALVGNKPTTTLFGGQREG